MLRSQRYAKPNFDRTNSRRRGGRLSRAEADAADRIPDARARNRRARLPQTRESPDYGGVQNSRGAEFHEPLRAGTLARRRDHGARLLEYGRDFDEAREEAERLSKAENLRYIHSANEPHLINGVGTYAIEIIEALGLRGEKSDAIFVPVGLGSGVETKDARTFADGVATRVPAALTFDIIRNGVDEIVLVSDSEIVHAIRLLWRTAHNLVEGAGAAATAATVKLRERLEGQNVVNVLTGANLDTASITKIFK